MICKKCQTDKPTSEYYMRASGIPERACKACRRARTASNPNRLANAQRYRDANRDACRERIKAHQQANRPYYAAKRATRRAQEGRAAFGDQGKVLAWYRARDALNALYGLSLEVDHIVPLQGANVCGLHAPWNLQLLPAQANASKGNRHTP